MAELNFTAVQKRRITGVLAIILILIIAGVAGFLLRERKKAKSQKKYPAEYAQKGSVVSGFPHDLLFDNAQTIQSFKINYGSSVQYTAEYDSKDNYGLVMTKADLYFKTNNFYISSWQKTAGGGSAYAVKGGTEINLQVSSIDQKTSHVIISYLQKQ